MNKKYESPVIEIKEVEVADIIQVSIKETPEALGRRGYNLGSVNADNINLFE